MDLREHLTAYPTVRKITATTRDVRDTLLASDGQMLLNGNLYRIRSKPLGARVHQVWLERWREAP